MKKLSYTLNCIKQNFYTFLSYFLRLSCSYSSHSLHHLSLGLCNSSLPSGKELNPSSQEDARFSGRCTSAYNFYFILRHPSLGLSNSSLNPRQRAQTFLSGRIMFFQAYCFVNVLTLSCLGSLWFGTHPYYSLNPCVHLCYLWAISIAKKAAIQNILFYVQSISIAKDRRFAEKGSPRLRWSQPNKVFLGIFWFGFLELIYL